MKNMICYILAVLTGGCLGGILAGGLAFFLWAAVLSFATVEWQMTTVMALVIDVSVILAGAGGGWLAGHYITQLFVHKKWL